MSHTLLWKYDSSRNKDIGEFSYHQFEAEFNCSITPQYLSELYTLSFKTEEEMVKFAMMYS